MSVELPPLPAVLFDKRGPLWEAIDAWYYASSGEQSGKRADAIEALIADQMRAYAAEALKARKPMTESECIKTLPRDVLHGDPVRLTFDSGPYEITRPSNVLLTVIRAIERANGIGEQT